MASERGLEYLPGALDETNGEKVWEMELSSNVHGAPMTYLAGEKQYIVMAIGGFALDAELIALTVD